MLLILILSIGIVSAEDTSLSEVQLDNEDISVMDIYGDNIQEMNDIYGMDDLSENYLLDEEVSNNNSNFSSNDFNFNSDIYVEDCIIDSTNSLESVDGLNTDSIMIMLNNNPQMIPCVSTDLTDVVLPDKYDLRAVVLEDGSIVSWVTPVKNQYYSGCWSFATMAMLESYLLKNWGIMIFQKII